MIIEEVPNPGILGLLLFVSPVLYMYLNTLAFKNLKTPNPIKDKPLTIASIVKHGNNFDLDALDFYTNAIARFSAFYETQYLSLNKEKIQVYKHQVAGHTKEVLRVMDGLILKPLNKKDLFARELAFYEEMNSPIASYIPTPRAFVPNYYGVMLANSDHNGKIPFMVLEDLNQKYQNPCVIDIKMGQQTYEPTASEAKIASELKKYCHQHEVGFRITGYKVFDITSETYRSYDKRLGRSLLPHFVKDCLASFVYNGMFYRRDVVLCIIQQLQRILRWMRRQNRYKFFCSSLLIVYDGNVLRKDAYERFLLTKKSKGDNETVENCADSADGNVTNCRHFIDKFRERDNYDLSNPSMSNRSSPISVRETAPSYESISCTGSTYTSAFTETEHEKSYKSFLSQHPSLFLPQVTNPNELVHVKMIDLAHSICTAPPGNCCASGMEVINEDGIACSDSNNCHVEYADVDRGYIHGLEVLIKIFEDILVTIDNTDGSNLTESISVMLTSENELGTEHDSTLEYLSALGHVYCFLGQFGLALSLTEEALAGYMKVFDENHFRVPNLKAKRDWIVGHIYSAKQSLLMGRDGAVVPISVFS